MEETKRFNKEIIIEFFKKHYKKVIAGVLALVVLAVSGVLVFQYAAAPEIEDIYDRMVYLLETSQDVNALIFGHGLPVWEDDSEYVQFENIYHRLDTARAYEIVMRYNAKYWTVEQIKDAVKSIYSQEYIDDVLNAAIFDGIAIPDGKGGSKVVVPRYYEEWVEGRMYLWQSKEFRVNPYEGMRIYDYSTMQVRSLGKTDRCVITIDTWLEDSPDQVENIEILIALQNGQWYLDNFVG